MVKGVAAAQALNIARIRALESRPMDVVSHAVLGATLAIGLTPIVRPG